MSLKNPVTPPGIDPGTVLLVAQRLNHYATPRRNHYEERQCRFNVTLGRVRGNIIAMEKLYLVLLSLRQALVKNYRPRICYLKSI